MVTDNYEGTMDAIVMNRRTVTIASLHFASVVNVTNCPLR